MNDHDLLRMYAASRDQGAFAQLVARHVALVLGAAQRQVRDVHLAEDVTQAVFIVLARKAGSLHAGTLTGWLLKTTMYAAREALRARDRRHKREERAAAMRTEETIIADADPQWKELAPILDEALGRLSDKDRSAISLRYLEGKTFAEVGKVVGISEQAAQKRVARAIEKMRAFLSRRNVTISAAALTAAMTEHGAATVRWGLIDAVTAAGTGAAAGPDAVAIAGAVGRTIFWKQMQIAGAALLAVMVLLAALASHRSAPPDAPPTARANPASTAPLTTRSGPLRVGLIVSHYTATGPSWTTRGPFGYLRMTQGMRVLEDPQVQLFAIIEPDTALLPEVRYIIDRHFPQRIVDGSDAAALRRLDVIVAYFAWNLRQPTLDAINAAVNDGVGLLIQASAGTYNPGYTPVVEALHAIQQGAWFYTTTPTECQVVAEHPILAGLQALPDRKITLPVLSGSIGQIKGTPLIETASFADALIRRWREEGSEYEPVLPEQTSAVYYPLYVAVLGKGRIVVCQWEGAGRDFRELTGGRFHIRCVQWLARRPVEP